MTLEFLDRAADVHHCLGRPSVNSVHPQMRQGRKCLLFIYYCFGTFLGANAAQSLENLYDWTDAVILRYCNNDMFVYRCDRRRMWGWYRGIAGKAFTKIVSHLSTTLRPWGTIAFLKEGALARCFTLQDGVLSIEPVSMGPFFITVYLAKHIFHNCFVS